MARHGLALVEAIGVDPDDALDCYRSLSWTVTGFVILEQTLDAVGPPPTHRPDALGARPRRRRPPSAFDTDELFRTTLALALDGLELRGRERTAA